MNEQNELLPLDENKLTYLIEDLPLNILGLNNNIHMQEVRLD